MIFTDLLFLLAFLPISVVIMLVLNENWEKNAASVLMSLVLLAWARPLYIALIILPAVLVYAAGRLMDKKDSPAIYISASLLTLILGIVFAVSCGEGKSLSAGVTAAAIGLMTYKAYRYLTAVKKGMPCEEDFLTLCVYLISYEFIFFNPLLDYETAREQIKNRSIKISSISLGTEYFIAGLAESAILGLSLDRVRISAIHTDILPWGDLVIGILATALECYIILDGFMRISAGLATINGIRCIPETNGLIPRLSIRTHLNDIYPEITRDIPSGRALLGGLLGASAFAGCTVAFGNGGGIIGFVLAGLMLVSLEGSGLFEKLFAIALALLGFFMTAMGGLDSLGRLSEIFSYGFDISYLLYEEIRVVIPWLIVALFCVSPMPRILAAMWRERMYESPASYSVMRIIGIVANTLLLGVSVLAAIGLR